MTTTDNSFGQSQALYARAACIPGRSNTRSKAPGRFGCEPGTGPLYALGGHGCMVVDADGREYVDMLCALGAVAIGHGAISAGAYAGAGVLSLPSRAEVLMAEAVLQHVAPWATHVRTVRTGSEALHAAYRIAKAATGRRNVIVFRGSYHGWHEWCAPERRVVMETATILREDWDRGERVYEFAYGEDLAPFFDGGPLPADRVAAVFVEPHRWQPTDPEWLRGLRRWCDASGALLVLDEMIYGGRWALGGATEHFGVVPHLACFGKALGNGAPVACVVGGDALAAHGEIVSGTFSGDPHAAAMCAATIEHYVAEPVILMLLNRGLRLRSGLDAAVGISGWAGQAHVEGTGFEHQRLRFDAPEDGRRFAAGMAARGILWLPVCANVMAAHTPQVIDRVTDAALATLREMRA